VGGLSRCERHEVLAAGQFEKLATQEDWGRRESASWATKQRKGGIRGEENAPTPFPAEKARGKRTCTKALWQRKRGRVRDTFFRPAMKELIKGKKRIVIWIGRFYISLRVPTSEVNRRLALFVRVGGKGEGIGYLVLHSREVTVAASKSLISAVKGGLNSVFAADCEVGLTRAKPRRGTPNRPLSYTGKKRALWFTWNKKSEAVAVKCHQ